MSSVPHSLRFALRGLRRNPLFTIVAVLTLALGIGANSGIFGIVYGVLFRPLPFERSEDLVFLTRVSQGELNPWHSGPNFLELQQEAGTLAGLAAYQEARLTLVAGGDPVLAPGATVSGSFFDVLEARPAMGRDFSEGDNDPGAAAVVVLAEGLWRERFGADPQILGREIQVEGRPRTVVGIMPQGFHHPSGARIWIPLRYGELFRNDEMRGANFLHLIGRVAPEATVERAAAEIETIGGSIKERFPHLASYDRYTAVSLLEHMVGDLRPALLILLGAVGFVLLIACANVANLMLSRGITRESEMAVRAALGASRRRLLGQALLESLVLAVLGSALGLLLAMWITDAFAAASSGGIPRLEAIQMDGPIIVFTAGIGLAATLIFGSVPALYQSRLNLAAALRRRGRAATSGRGGGRARSALVIGETALAVVLLAGAALLVRSFRQLAAVDPGFRTERMLSFSLALPFSRYEGPAEWRAFYAELLPRLESLPGVRKAEAVSELPLRGETMAIGFQVEGRSPESSAEQRFILLRSVTPGYLAGVGVPLLRGRSLTQSDGPGSPPVAVISDAAARRFFPDRDPIGEVIQLGFNIGEGQVSARVVGVVGDVMATGLAQGSEPHMYMANAQLPLNSMTMVLSTDGEPRSLVPSARSVVQALDPQLPLARVTTLDELLSGSVAQPRFYMLTLGGFAAVALALAAVGIFGVLSYSVSSRRRDIGVRIALGATPRAVLGAVMRQGMRLAVTGLLLGIVGALFLSRLLESLLFRVDPLDPIAFIGTVVLLLLVALIAVWWPARRATRVDPITILRFE